MAYVVSAVWTAKPGKEELVRDVIRQLTPLSRAEPGCRFYQALLRSCGTTNVPPVRDL